MLGGFDPRLEELFVRRNRGGALVLGVLFLLVVGVTGWLAYPPKKEDVVDVQLEPEIQDFVLEEEDEPEPEPEPPPPPNTKVEVVSKPKPKPKPKPPDKKITEASDESDKEKTVEVGAGGGQAGGSSGGGGNKPPKAVDKPKPGPKPEPKVEPKPKPKPKPKAEIDPTVPIDRPENATAPKLKTGNPPDYPKELRDQGITGKVVVRLHVHRDGTVRGAKIISKSNNATTEEDKQRANKLFVAAVGAAVKTWTFEPAKLEGTPISTFHTITVPFTLNAG